MIHLDKVGSVQFSHSVMSDSLWPHGLQHARPPCPSPTPGVYSNSSPSSWWCHPTILSSVIPFSCLQSFPASGSFPMGQFFASSGQSFGASASASASSWIERIKLTNYRYYKKRWIRPKPFSASLHLDMVSYFDKLVHREDFNVVNGKKI